jgi:hypothetical protein
MLRSKQRDQIMRKTFPGYYRPTEDEFYELWKTCLFVLDANVLLNLYRYSQGTSGSFTAILDQISDRLWVPHQAALEYQQRRLDVIAQQAKAYDEIQELLDETQNKLENRFRGFQRHPLIDADRLLKKIARAFTAINKELNKRKQEHPDLLENDHLKDTITSLFEGKVGPPYSQEQLDEIYKRGQKRYEREVPPGYLDGNKEGVRKYGDLVLWFQVIDKAKETKEPIILVTDDRKEDWWLRFKGQTIGPRPELVEEILSQAGVSFYMYQADPFMEHVRKYLERQVKQEAIDEVRDVRRRDEAYMEATEIPMLPLIADNTLKALGEATLYPQEQLRRTLEQIALYPQEQLQRMAEQMALYPQEQLQRMAEQMTALYPQEQLRRMAEQMTAFYPQEQLRRMAEQMTALYPQEQLKRIVEGMTALALQISSSNMLRARRDVATGSKPEDPDELNEQPDTGDE